MKMYKTKIRPNDKCSAFNYNGNALQECEVQSSHLFEERSVTMEQIVPKNTVGKRTYSVDEIRSILSIGRRKAYELCNSGSFKIVRVGRVIRVSKLSFDEWLDDMEHNGGNQ